MTTKRRIPREPDRELRALVIHLRERTTPPTSFGKIAKYLGCSRQNVQKLYKKGKEALERGKIQNADTGTKSKETTDLYRRWMHTTSRPGK